MSPFSLNNVNIIHVGRDSSVGIATRYGLDGPRIECRWGRDFPHPSRPVLGGEVRVASRGQEIVSVASQGDRFKCISCVHGCQPQA